MMTKRQREALLTREKIYSAAKELFCEKGYNHVTIDDIVNRASVAKGSFYNHFDSKEHVIEDIYNEYDDLFSNAYEAVKDLRGTARITSFFMIYFNTVRTAISMGLLKAIYSAQLYSQYGTKIIDDSRKYHQILCALLESMEREGLIRRGVKLNDIAHVLRTFIAGLEYEWCLSDGTFDLLGEAQKNLEILMLGFVEEGQGEY